MRQLPLREFSKTSIKVGVPSDRAAFGYARMLELLVAALVLFLLFSGMSFLFMRPALNESRTNIQRDWYEFMKEVKERNDMLPGLLETVKMFQPFFTKTAAKMLEAKAVIKRSREPEIIIASVDKLDMDIKTLETLVSNNPEMLEQSSFRQQWDLFTKKNNKVVMARTLYNSSVQKYNNLIDIFPQNIFASLLGYGRAVAYPTPSSLTE